MFEIPHVREADDLIDEEIRDRDLIDVEAHCGLREAASEPQVNPEPEPELEMYSASWWHGRYED
jgi:hypothetical protein